MKRPRSIDRFGKATLWHHQIDSAIQWAPVLTFARQIERGGVTLVRAEMASDVLTLRFEKSVGVKRVYRLFGVSWPSLGSDTPSWPKFLETSVDEFVRGVPSDAEYEVEE